MKSFEKHYCLYDTRDAVRFKRNIQSVKNFS